MERAVRPGPAVDGDAIRVLGVGRQAVDDGVVDVLARRPGDHLPGPVAHLDGGPTVGGGRGTDAAALVAARAIEVVVVDHLPATVDELLEEPSPADQRSVRGHVDEVDEGLEASVVVAHPRTVRPRRASDLDRASSRLSIARTLQNVGGRPVEFGCKTRTSRRTVDLDDNTMRHLARWSRRLHADGLPPRPRRLDVLQLEPTPFDSRRFASR